MIHIAYNAMLLRKPYSGVEYAIHDLMEALALHGRHRYTFFIPEYDLLPPSLRQNNSRHVSINRVRFPFHSRALRLLWEQLILPGRIKEAKASLLHAPGYLAPLRSPVPYLLTVYDIEAIYNPRFCRPSNRLNYSFFLPRSINKAKAIITPSRTTHNQIVQRFPECADKLHTVPLGIHDIFFSDLKKHNCETFRRSYGLPQNYILFVGNQEPRKNIPALLEVTRKLRSTTHPSLKLVLVGAKGRSSRKLRTPISELGRIGSIIRTGHVSREDLPLLYRYARALVFPSWDEGFGLPPLEAMASGCPVVCSNAGALAEVSSHTASFSPDSPEQLYAQITRVLTDRKYRESLISAGRKYVSKFRWHTVACQTEILYENIIGRKLDDER